MFGKKAEQEADEARVNAVFAALNPPATEITPKKEVVLKYDHNDIHNAIRQMAFQDVAKGHFCAASIIKHRNGSLEAEVTVKYFDTNADVDQYIEQARKRTKEGK